MKYLWVEDFDGGNNKDTNKPYWLNYFSLKEENVIIKENLADALEQITNNPESFDAILLDISLVVEGSNNTLYQTEHWAKWYETYFKDYIDEKYYQNEDHRKNGTGILLYLYLRERYHFPKERICFLSAYTGDNNKAGTKEYKFLREAMANLGCKLGMAREKPERQEESFHSNKGAPNNKYGDVLADMPYASSNTIDVPEKDELFHREFIQKNDTKYVKIRRFLLDASDLILNHYNSLSNEEQEAFVHVRNNFYFQRIKGTITVKGQDTYSKESFVEMLKKIRLHPLCLALPEQEEEGMLAMMESLVFFAESIVEPELSFTPRLYNGIDGFHQCDITKDVLDSSREKGNCKREKQSSKTLGHACKEHKENCPHRLSGFHRGNIALLKRVRNLLAHGNNKGDFLHAKELVAATALRTIFDVDSVSGYHELEQDFLRIEEKQEAKPIIDEIVQHNNQYFSTFSPEMNRSDAVPKQLQTHLRQNNAYSRTLPDGKRNPAFLYQYYLNFFVSTSFSYRYVNNSYGSGEFYCKPVVNSMFLKHYLPKETEGLFLQHAFDRFMDGE